MALRLCFDASQDQAGGAAGEGWSGSVGFCVRSPSTDGVESAPADTSPEYDELANQIFDAVVTDETGYIDSDKMELLCNVIFAEADIVDNHASRTKLWRHLDAQPPYGKISKQDLRKFFQQQLSGRRSGGRKQPFSNLKLERLPAMLEKCAELTNKQSKRLFRAAENAEVNLWYKKVSALGRGQYAAVELWEAQDLAPKEITELSGAKFAAKIFDKNGQDRAAVYEVLSEFLLMKSLRRDGGFARHRNVVQLFHLIETPENMFILMEYMAGGTLYNVLKKNANGLPERHAHRISKQILEGLQFIHAHDIIHLDLKPENILCDRYESAAMNVKITDLGLSAVIVNRNAGLNRFPGSPMYLAPEIFSREVQYTEKADMWSFGGVLHELLCGPLPWANVRTVDLLKNVVCGYLAKRNGLKHFTVGYQGFYVVGDEVTSLLMWGKSGPPESHDSSSLVVPRGRAARHDRAAEQPYAVMVDEWAQQFVAAWQRERIPDSARVVIAHTLFPAPFHRFGASLLLGGDYYRDQEDSRENFQRSEMNSASWVRFHSTVENARREVREEYRGQNLPTFKIRDKQPRTSMSTSRLSLFDLDDAQAIPKPPPRACGCDADGDCGIM